MPSSKQCCLFCKYYALMPECGKKRNHTSTLTSTSFPCSGFSNGSAEGALHRIHNAVIEGVNRNIKLPRFVIFTPDCDLIVHANFYDYGVQIVFDRMISWIMKKIEKIILNRKEELKEKCPGAINHEPRFMWVKMITRPFIKDHPIKDYNNTVKLRQKFNGIH